MSEYIVFPALFFAQMMMLVFSIVFFLYRNDEVPLFISSLLFYCTSYRYWAVTSGIGSWVKVSSYNFATVTEDLALQALGYITLGQFCLLFTYLRRQKQVIPIGAPVTDRHLLDWLRPRVIILTIFCLPLVAWTRTAVEAGIEEGRSLATEISSYLFLFPMALVGVSILNISLWRAGGYPTPAYKIIATLLLIVVAYLTFGSTLRFQFLGWIVGAGVIVSANYARKKRLIILASAMALCLGVFAFAGSLRSVESTEATGSQAAWERFASAEDANMLDGFVFVENIYPNLLDYSLGMDHLEILLRPIPRSIWPEKPVGGYANKLGLNDYSRGTTGISPTVFGSFYSEGGVIGIVLLSILYGIGLAAVSSYSVKLQPFASFILRAVLCASLIPLLRGGDLAGIFAWIGMAFWPCFLLLWLKRTSLRLKPNSFSRKRISHHFRIA